MRIDYCEKCGMEHLADDRIYCPLCANYDDEILTRLDEIMRDCRAYHKAHPEVWRLFEKFTLDRIRVGFQNYSAMEIFQRIRWHTRVVELKNRKKDSFKVNHNYFPLYARKFMRTHREYNSIGMMDSDDFEQGFFRVQNLPSAMKLAKGEREIKPSHLRLVG